MREDLYTRITNNILAELEKGTRPWIKPWNAEHAGGRITRPLRANGIPYRGINVLSLWMEAEARGYAAPIWITYRQALEFKRAIFTAAAHAQRAADFLYSLQPSDQAQAA
jgi:antirestriction protein ArdC